MIRYAQSQFMQPLGFGGLPIPTKVTCQICGGDIASNYTAYRSKLGRVGHMSCVTAANRDIEGAVRLSDLLVDPRTTKEWHNRKVEWLDAWDRAWADYRAAGEERRRQAPVAQAPVVGVRAFVRRHVARGGERFDLHACYANYVWPKGEVKAGCTIVRGGGPMSSEGPAPVTADHDLTACSCGFHAYHPEYLAKHLGGTYYTCTGAGPLAVVVGYGRVAIHDNEGWRAQYARIVGIIATEPDSADVARHYEVPLVAPEAVTAFALEHGVSATPKTYRVLGEPGLERCRLPVDDIYNATDAEVEGFLLAVASVAEVKEGRARAQREARDREIEAYRSMALNAKQLLTGGTLTMTATFS